MNTASSPPGTCSVSPHLWRALILPLW